MICYKSIGLGILSSIPFTSPIVTFGMRYLNEPFFGKTYFITQGLCACAWLGYYYWDKKRTYQARLRAARESKKDGEVFLIFVLGCILIGGPIGAGLGIVLLPFAAIEVVIEYFFRNPIPETPKNATIARGIGKVFLFGASLLTAKLFWK